MTTESDAANTTSTNGRDNVHRFHLPHRHLASVFGNDWFALKAEAFARFFGTPRFLVSQTVVVGVWVLVNASGVTQFDVYPFILLNLAFSFQSAYAAPLILLSIAKTYIAPANAARFSPPSRGHYS
jgi:uncharacterized membrane protein